MRVTDRTTMPSDSNVQHQRLREATRQLEAQFLHQLLRAMRRTVPNTQSSYASQMYIGMMDEALAQQLARSDQFGLGKLLYEKLIPYIEPSDGAPDTAPRQAGGNHDKP